MANLFYVLLPLLSLIAVIRQQGLFTFNKTNLFQSSAQCRRIESNGNFLDFVSFGPDIIAAEDDLDSVSVQVTDNDHDGRLILLRNLDSNSPTTEEIKLDNFPPNTAFHPFALYLVKPNELYVLNHAFQNGGTRIEIFNINYLTARYHGTLYLDSSLTGFFGDFIIDTEHEAYLTQYSPIPVPTDDGHLSLSDYMNMLNSDESQIKNAYVYHCIYARHAIADCRPITATKSHLVTGITKDLNENYFVSSRSTDSDKVEMYTKDEKGDLNEQNKIRISEKTEKIRFDEDTGKIIGSSTLRAISLFKNGSSIGGALEINGEGCGRNINYRRLFMQQNEFTGANCAIRSGNSVLIGSYQDKGGYVCRIDS